MLADLSGTLTGTIGGKVVAFGPNQAIPLQATQGYDLYTHNPSFLSVWAQNDQYNVTLSFNGPFVAGRTYRIYDPTNPNDDKFDSFIVTALIRAPVSVMTKAIVDLAPRDKQVRITAITSDYIDIEFLFTLDKPGAVQERINVRVKNVLNENRNLRTQSEGDPFWSYANVDRLVEPWGYSTQRMVGYASAPTTTRVQISQRLLTTPVSDISYGGKTEPANSQWIRLTQPKSSELQPTVEYGMGVNGSAGAGKSVEISWPNFTGVGIYTGDKVDISFLNSQGTTAAGYWRIRPGKLAIATTKWLVNVQRVTAEVIEGTYTIVDAPIYEKGGTAAQSALESVSGSFKVIYPR